MSEPRVDSFNSRLRHEFLNGRHFDILLEATVLLADWRIDYNMNRLHDAQNWLTPVEFVETGPNKRQLQLL